jgi:hypothetical protein
MADITFYLDPACYWTWRASRWLKTVSASRGLSIEWASFSLKVLYGADMNPDWREMLETAHNTLRLVEALRAAGRHDDLDAFYTELGVAHHEQGNSLTPELVAKSAEAAGVADLLAATDDASWDAAIEGAFAAALGSAGPDIGSPVLVLDGAPRGLYGPVFSRVPTDEESGPLWDSIETLLRSEIFYEVKRGRP